MLWFFVEGPKDRNGHMRKVNEYQYDSFSDKVLDQVTKMAKIEKSFKHIFSSDFAFSCIRGKPV